MTFRPIHLIVVACALGLSACEQPPKAQLGIAVRDSVGIRVVEVPAIKNLNLPEWHLVPEAERTIRQPDSASQDSGAPEFELWQVQDVGWMAENEIAILNGGTQEILLFDMSGRYLRSVGRSGEGPGEFLGLARIDRGQGDSIIAWDQRLGRFSVFTPTGRFQRSFSIPGGASPLFQFVGAYTDGSFVVAERSYPSQLDHFGFQRGSAVFLRYDRDGVFLDSIPTESGVEVYVASFAGNPGTVTTPFFLQNHQALSESGLYVGTQDHYEIRKYDPSGIPITIIRVDQERSRLSQERVDAFVAGELGRLRSQGVPPQVVEAFAGLYRGLPFPETCPAHGSLLTDSENNLWVQDFTRSEDPTVLWTVFSESGTPIARVRVASDVVLEELGRERVISRSTDDLGREFVEVSRIEKGNDLDKRSPYGGGNA